ncbi:MAG: hypothetical protein QM765_26155 [Myxococcales bacterium]
MRDRGYRRSQHQRMERKVKRLPFVRREGEWKARHLGLLVSTHGKPCSCPMCGNPRRYEKQKLTVQERRARQEPLSGEADE